MTCPYSLASVILHDRIKVVDSTVTAKLTSITMSLESGSEERSLFPWSELGLEIRGYSQQTKKG